MVVNMPIIRAIHDKDHPYTVISNALVNDPSLSLNALAVMTYVLSKPDDWSVSATDIQRRFKIGRGKAYNILNELIERGYLTRVSGGS
jgi:DNA-binding MarR family transcriptional regulator